MPIKSYSAHCTSAHFSDNTSLVTNDRVAQLCKELAKTDTHYTRDPVKKVSVNHKIH